MSVSPAVSPLRLAQLPYPEPPQMDAGLSRPLTTRRWTDTSLMATEPSLFTSPHVAASAGAAAAATKAAAPHSMLVILVCILVVSFVSCCSETVEGGRWGVRAGTHAG